MQRTSSGELDGSTAAEAELSTVIGAEGLVAAAAASAPAFGCPPHRFLPLLYSGCMPPPKPAVPQKAPAEQHGAPPGMQVPLSGPHSPMASSRHSEGGAFGSGSSRLPVSVGTAAAAAAAAGSAAAAAAASPPTRPGWRLRAAARREGQAEARAGRA